ncbi:hypothetical protein ACFVT5_37755 [Streptomyces sp. NPDC058001]|uniref:hypothetical protein n=1 Tax=Streptomyces sp. NPDC058001 TaxID=3346300 RepID=UPI0036F0F7EC
MRWRGNVRVGARYAQREAAERRQRAEERRARELRRGAERARLAREADARRERARAEVARREAELAARRSAERGARLDQAGAEQSRADARGLEEVRELIAEAEQAVLESALAEAAERLDVVRPAAEDVVATAADLGDPGLADETKDVLRAATEALTARSATGAIEAVAVLEGRLPDAERRLDELELAYQRRLDLVEALRDAITGEGFAFEGGEDQGGSFRLHFTRPTGATCETTVATEDDGTLILVYYVEGEPDVSLYDHRDETVCDTTEALLERVHEALGGDDGFVVGEVAWDGKPPCQRAKPLPRGTHGTWTAP